MRIVKKLIAGFIALGAVGIILAILLLLSPIGQQWAIDYTIRLLREEANINVEIQSIHLRPLSSVVFHGVKILNSEGEEEFMIDHLIGHVSLGDLFRGSVKIHTIEVKPEADSHLFIKWHQEDNTQHLFLNGTFRRHPLEADLLLNNLPGKKIELPLLQATWDDRLRLELRHTSGKYEYHLSDKSGFTMLGKGEVDLGHFKLANNQIEAFYQEYHFANQAPFDLIWQNGKFFLPSLFLSLDGSNIKLAFEADIKNKQLDGSLDFFNIPLLSHLPVKGHLNGSMEISGQWNNPQGSLYIESADLSHPDIREKARGRLHATLKERLLDFEGELSLQEIFPSHFFGNIQWNKPLLQDATIQFALNSSGEISQLIQACRPSSETSETSGKVDLTLTGSGPLLDPQIYHTIIISNGRYEKVKTGTLFTDIQATIKGEGSHLCLESFEAHDGSLGKVSATGGLSIDPEGHFPFFIDGHIQQAKIANSNRYSARTSGDFHLTGDTRGVLLQGNLELLAGSYQIPTETPKQVKTLEVTFINSPEEESLPSRYSNFPVQLDLSLTSPNKLVIEGRGLTSEWKGLCSIRGDLDHPEIHGQFISLKGEYSFAGKLFKISQGSISFRGNLESARLAVIGEHPLTNAKVEVSLTGALDDLRFHISSTPSMSNHEILSLLLFDQKISELSETQHIQLAQAAISLSAGKFGTNPIDEVRKKMKLDRLNIRGSKVATNRPASQKDLSSKGDGTGELELNSLAAKNDLSIELGKYLTEKIFLSLSKSVRTDNYKLSMEASLTKTLKLEADISRDSAPPGTPALATPSKRLSLLWRKDY